MSHLELKKKLIDRITEIDDVSFLRAIQTIIDSKTHTQVLSLTKEQRSEIIESRKEIEFGQFADQAEVDLAFERWLNER